MLDWLFNKKKKEDTLRTDTIKEDLREIRRNNECGGDDYNFNTKVVHVIVKGKYTDYWRVYFLNRGCSFAITPRGSSIQVTTLWGGLHKSDYYEYDDVVANDNVELWDWVGEATIKVYTLAKNWLAKNTNISEVDRSANNAKNILLNKDIKDSLTIHFKDIEDEKTENL